MLESFFIFLCSLWSSWTSLTESLAELWSFTNLCWSVLTGPLQFILWAITLQKLSWLLEFSLVLRRMFCIVSPDFLQYSLMNWNITLSLSRFHLCTGLSSLRMLIGVLMLSSSSSSLQSPRSIFGGGIDSKSKIFTMSFVGSGQGGGTQAKGVGKLGINIGKYWQGIWPGYAGNGMYPICIYII